MRKLFFTLCMIGGISVSQDCQAKSWLDTIAGRISIGIFAAGTGSYGFYRLWYFFFPLAKAKIDDFKAHEIADLFFIQLKMYSECTPAELKTKRKLHVLRTRIMEQLQERKPQMSIAAQRVIELLNAILVKFDQWAMQQGLMPTYSISAQDGTHWYDRAVQTAFVDSFLLAIKSSTESSEQDIARKIDDEHLYALVFDKLLAKLDKEPETPLWVARKYLVKVIKEWLIQKDEGESTMVMKALDVVNKVYQAREQLKDFFGHAWQQQIE